MPHDSIMVSSVMKMLACFRRHKYALPHNSINLAQQHNDYYWHCCIVCIAGSMKLPSIRLSVPSFGRYCGGSADVSPVARRYRSTAAQLVLSSKCVQCHIVSWCRKLNTDSSYTVMWPLSRHYELFWHFPWNLHGIRTHAVLPHLSTHAHTHAHTHTRLTALFLDCLGEPVPER